MPQLFSLSDALDKRRRARSEPAGSFNNDKASTLKPSGSASPWLDSDLLSSSCRAKYSFCSTSNWLSPNPRLKHYGVSERVKQEKDYSSIGLNTNSPSLRPANQVRFVISHIPYNGENKVIVWRGFPPYKAYNSKLLLVCYITKQPPLGRVNM